VDQIKVYLTTKESPEQNEIDATPHRKISTWLRLGISAILLLVLLLYVDLAESWRVVREADIALVIASFIVLLGLRFLSAYRWFVLLKGKNAVVTYRTIVRLNFIGVFCGTFMPGGTELAGIFMLAKLTSDLALTVSSLLVERVLALTALLVLVLLGLLIAPPGLPSILGYGAGMGLMVLALGILASLHPRVRRVINHLLSHGWIAPIGRRVNKLFVRLDTYANERSLMVYSLGLAFCMQLLRVACTIVVAWALGVHLPIATFVAIVPIIFLIVLLPISVGGLGVRETAFVSTFALVGVSAESAFTLSLLLYLISMLTTLPGAYFYATGKSMTDQTNHST